jgi:NAD(P)-dependent dehydrogenase (short-subunit alcohol dehydrogenase family)
MADEERAIRAVVTGGSRGIGQAICNALADEGATVINLDVLDGAETGSLVGDRYEHVRCDLAVPADIRAAFARADEVFAAPPTVLVNCAATFHYGHLLDVPIEDIDRVLAVNVRACMLCSQEAGRRMARAGAGRIVNIASTAAFMGWRNETAYCASKGAVVALTRAMAVDLGPLGIAVNAVAPGSVDTPGVGEVMHESESLAHDLARTPLGRWGQPAEIARAVRFLALDAPFTTGEVITVDGGFMAAGMAFFGGMQPPPYN